MSGVMGIDPSLTGTGLAHWSPEDGWDTGTIKSAGKATATYDDTGRRLDTIVGKIRLQVQSWDPALVVIEYPAYSVSKGHATDRAGLFWLTVQSLRSEWPKRRVAYCAANTRIRYALGKGTGSKDEVLAATIKRYTDASVSNNNEADAVLLAALGARWYGEQQGISTDYLRVDNAPQACRDAVRRVQWPPTLSL